MILPEWAQYASDVPRLRDFFRASHAKGEVIPSIVSALDVTGAGLVAEVRDDLSARELAQLATVLGAAIPTLRTVTVVVSEWGVGWCNLAVAVLDVATGDMGGYIDYYEGGRWVSAFEEDAAQIVSEMAHAVAVGLAAPHHSPTPQAALKGWIKAMIDLGLVVDAVEVV